MRKFEEVYNKIINEDFIYVENINNVIEKANNIVYETNYILPCPKQLFNIVKTNILKLIENKDYSSIKINIKEVLQDNFILEQEDNNLVKVLLKLFENHNNAYFNIKIEGNNEYYYDKKGEYILPKGFIENINSDTLHYSYPKIKPLIINNEILDNFIKKYKRDIKYLKEIYSKQQKAIEIFKENILNFNDFGTIIIYPWNCTIDDLNINLPTLDEAIEHECQHLCIFLLSLAKTCIYVGLHFSNNIKSATFSYPLKASEFITLAGSYCNILIRIYKQIKEPKSIEEFIKTVLDLSIYEKTNQDIKYINALNSSQQFPKIKEFYKEIWKDSKFGIYKKDFKNNEIIKTNLTQVIPNNKFEKLIKWTLKNFKENLKNE